MEAHIYFLSDPETGNIRYVGKTNDPKKRLIGHLKEKKNTRKNCWARSLLKRGVKPVLEVIESFPHDDDSLWEEAERFWISYLRFLGCDLCNHDSGGNSGKRQTAETIEKRVKHFRGIPKSPESIAKMKATKKANMTPERRSKLAAINKGRKFSDERRKAHSEALKGRAVSEETRRKLSESHKRWHQLHPKPPKPPKVPVPRKPVSAETRERMRQAQLGKKQSPELIAKRIKNMIGVPRSEETRRKISIGHMGKPKPRKKIATQRKSH